MSRRGRGVARGFYHPRKQAPLARRVQQVFQVPLHADRVWPGRFDALHDVVAIARVDGDAITQPPDRVIVRTVDAQRRATQQSLRSTR